jgi:hypothetical protein
MFIAFLGVAVAIVGGVIAVIAASRSNRSGDETPDDPELALHRARMAAHRAQMTASRAGESAREATQEPDVLLKRVWPKGRPMPSREELLALPQVQIHYTSKTSQGSSGVTKAVGGAGAARMERGEGPEARPGTPVSSLAELSALPAGTPVLLTAKVAARTPEVRPPFVAAVIDQFCGLTEDNEPLWDLVQLAAPSLWLELPDGELPIVNEGYGLYLALTEYSMKGNPLGRAFYQPQVRDFTWDEATKTGTQRATGIMVGDTVVVSGHVSESGTPGFVAINVAFSG